MNDDTTPSDDLPDAPDDEIRALLAVDPLDDVTRRRLVRDTLDQVDRSNAPRSRFVAAASVAAAILLGVLVGVILVNRPEPPVTTAAAPEKAADDATVGEAANPSAPAGAAERSVGNAFTPLGDAGDVTGDDRLRARMEALLLRGGNPADVTTTGQYACTERSPEEFGLVAITAAATGTLQGEPVNILVGTAPPDGSILAVAVRPATCEILTSVPLSIG